MLHPAGNWTLEPVFISGVCRMGEEFSCRSRRFDAGILCVFQGEATRSGGKRPAQTACNTCEYRFLAGSRICFCQGGGRRRAGARQGQQRGQGQIMPRMECDFPPDETLVQFKTLKSRCQETGVQKSACFHQRNCKKCTRRASPTGEAVKRAGIISRVRGAGTSPGSSGTAPRRPRPFLRRAGICACRSCRAGFR